MALTLPENVNTPEDLSAIQAGLGADGTTVTDDAQSVIGAIGVNSANNAFVSSAVVANEDGSALERLEQIQEAVNIGSGTSLGANKSLVDALGTTGLAITDSAVSVIGVMGANNANNAFASNLVASNEDGSMLERLEFIQTLMALRQSIPRILKKSLTFDGGAGTGATGTVSLFTVTGLVKMRVFGKCTTLLASDAAPGGATVEVGIAGTVNKYIAQTTAENVDAGEIWHDATPDIVDELDSVSGFHINNGADIILTIATDDVVSGAIDFICEWYPLEDGATVVGV